MAEISIPSPSVFLRPSPPPSLPIKPDTGEVGKTVIKQVRRPTAQAKTKKAQAGQTSTSAAGAEGDGGSASKPKQSKSRNGCATCKAKRLKCSEEKPGCQQCLKRGVECGGYKKDFKWRPFEETNVKFNIDRQRQAVSPTGHRSVESSKPTSPAVETSPALFVPERPQGEKRKDSKRSSPNDHESTSASLPARPLKEGRRRPRAPVVPHPPPVPVTVAVQEQASSPTVTASESHSLDTATVATPRTFTLPLQVPRVPPGLSPTLTEILRPFAENSSPEDDFINFSLPEGMHFPLTPLPAIDPTLLDDFSGATPLVEGDEVDDGGTGSGTISLLDSAGLTSPRTPTSAFSNDALLGSYFGDYLYTQPYFADDSPEMLTMRFTSLTCGILSLMDGPTENPWRTLIWPLALSSPALYHAVLSMTAFHSSTDFPALRVTGHEHKQTSIRYIQEGIRDNSMTDQTAIATALALGFSESWDQHTATGNTHIKGAQVLVKRAIAEHERSPLVDGELARLKFLCNAWVYMDVIARLTSVDSDDSNDFDNTFLFSADAPNMVMGDSVTPGFGIDFGMPIDARLDPLMGCANTLFPLIGRVANLVRKVCRSQSNSVAVISTANDLKSSLETWEPPDYIERPEDPSTDVTHTLQTAEAYRWATLLHLHSSVPELPSNASGELAQQVLQYLATVPLSSRTVIVQIYPLMVAGCEASTAEDRQWVRDRWAAMGTRMRIGIIDKSATVTEEVWRRRDAYEAQPSTRRKLVATADLQPAREKGAPLSRRATDAPDNDPGRTGMVFTYVEDDADGRSDSLEQRDGRWPKKRPPLQGRKMKNGMDPAYTVRGHLHWVGVMWDWGWEVLLG